MLFYRLTGSFAGLSFAGALCVIFSYILFPNLRKHPTNMVFFLSICDLCFSLKFIITALAHRSVNLLNNPTACYLQAGMAQFWGLASISWNCMISMNLIFTLRSRGFVKTSNFSKMYHIYVWSLSLLTTGIMFTQPHRIGDSGDGTCWINGIHDPFRLLFFVPLLAYMLISVFAFLMAVLRMNDGGMNSEVRRGVFIRMLVYVGVFLICWIGPVAHRIQQLAQPGNEDQPIYEDNPTFLQYWDALGIAIQGFANAMVWMSNPSFYTPFRTKIWKRYCGCFVAAEEKIPLLSDLNNSLQDSRNDINRIDSMLRKNMITCILLGIRKSLRVQTGEEEVTMASYSEVKEYAPDEFKSTAEDGEYPRSYSFVDYAGPVFAHMRQLSGITPKQYEESLKPSHFLGKIGEHLQKFTEGRSSSLFISSPDKQFILKTIPESDAQLLLRILPNLYSYFLANPHSLLTRFYGIHGVRVRQGTDDGSDVVTVVVMSNVFSTDHKIHECYDLKGSWIHRKAGKERILDSSKLGMDVDFHRKLKLLPEQQKLFIDQISKDALFLCSLNIMDYSLLVGIHFTDTTISGPEREKDIEMARTNSVNVDFTEETRGANGLAKCVARDKSAVYYLGIIDFLQLYDKNKKFERFAKVYLLHKSKEGISVMPPLPYARRYIEKISSIVE